MKRWMTLAFALILAPSAHASYGVSTFEDLRLAPNSYNDNAGASGQFVSGGVSFTGRQRYPVCRARASPDPGGTVAHRAARRGGTPS